MAHHTHLPLVRDAPRPSLAFRRASHNAGLPRPSTPSRRPPASRADVAVRPEWRTLPSGTARDDDVMETLQQQLHAFSAPSPSPTPRRQLRELQRQQQQQQQAEAKAQQQSQPAAEQLQQGAPASATAEDLLTAINKAAVEGPSGGQAASAWSRLANLAGDSRLLQRAQELLPGFKFQETVRFLWSLGQLADHLRTAPPTATPAALRALPAVLTAPLTHALTAHLSDTASFRWHADRYLLLAGALDGLHRIACHCSTLAADAAAAPATPRISLTPPAPGPRPRRQRSSSPSHAHPNMPPSGPPPAPSSRRAAVTAAAAAAAAVTDTPAADGPVAAAAPGSPAGSIRQASADLQAAICTAATKELRRPAMTDACAGQLADLLEAISRSCGHTAGARSRSPALAGSSSNKAQVALAAAADAARAHMRQEHGRYSVAFAAAALRIIAAASGTAAPSSPLLDTARGVAQTAAVQVALAHERQEASAEEESAALVQLLRSFLLLGFWPGEALMQAATARLWLHIPRLPATLLAAALSTCATFNYRPCSSFLTAARRRLTTLRGALPLEQEAALEASLSALAPTAPPAPALRPSMTIVVPALGATPPTGSMLRQQRRRAAEVPQRGLPAQHQPAAASREAGVGAEARRALMSAL